MGARRVGRERALQALYQLEQDPKVSPAQALEASWVASSDDDAPRDREAHAFAMELVDGVQAHRAAIDALLEKHSHNWRVDRMSRIDRNILRIGVFELLHLADVPRKVTINEAVELGKAFGNEDSSAFINGMLDRIATAVDKA